MPVLSLFSVFLLVLINLSKSIMLIIKFKAFIDYFKSFVFILLILSKSLPLDQDKGLTIPLVFTTLLSLISYRVSKEVFTQ